MDIIKFVQDNIEMIVEDKDLFAQLSARINDMILNDFTGLINALYRMDIPEDKLRYMLDELQNEDAGKIIAGMIIEREYEKIKSRRSNRQDTDFNEEERW